MTPDKFIIRTSDRSHFRRCRQQWDFTSKIRMNYEFVPGIEPLDFGVAIHAGAEVYYDPARWEQPRHIVHIESIQAFRAHMNDWKKRLQQSDQWEMQRDRWHELHDLGIGMLEHYFSWAPQNIDKDMKPILSEIEFEVPLTIPDNDAIVARMDPDFNDHWLNNVPGEPMMRFNGNRFVPVVYQGRVDVLMQHVDTGYYWIRDHKTAAQFGQIEHLELDQQCGSYVWALWKKLKLLISGVQYSEWRKDVPNPPRILKSGALSQAKNQKTTKALYREKIRDLGHDPSLYDDFLNSFVEGEFFRMTEVFRGGAELDDLECNIVMEAIDMLDDPFIYPNPDRWNCNGCAFRSPCLMKRDNSTWEHHLNHSGLYEKRKTDDPRQGTTRTPVVDTGVQLGPSSM